ncbi:hypothetical protein NE237_005138 [Protea cynaroides]|uniref:RRM domain-containing protein n=1 Tax=Protea cynaroides TaxID=273540 RepID=A0A9Q0KKS8_9MAGN|nr:hypothetical protein NE237_005138 [Protea cynaroides]
MTMSNNSNNYNNHSNNMGQFGDTTLTKVFVGGLAWETQKETLREHFEKYGEILEAVIISDKVTGRSKGYGFVTFKEAEAAKKACEDATPVINGRRANCNLASLGARRPRSTSSYPIPQGSHSSSSSSSNNKDLTLERDPRHRHLQLKCSGTTQLVHQLLPTTIIIMPFLTTGTLPLTSPLIMVTTRRN